LKSLFAGSSAIQAIKAELAAKREASRKARAMTQLESKQKYEAHRHQQHQQQRRRAKPVDTRVVTVQRARKSRGSSKKRRAEEHHPTLAANALRTLRASDENASKR
jgi:hypothetical protein